MGGTRNGLVSCGHFTMAEGLCTTTTPRLLTPTSGALDHHDADWEVGGGSSTADGGPWRCRLEQATKNAPSAGCVDPLGV